MGTASYTEGGVDAISRLRSEIYDVDTASPHFSDAELQRWIDESRTDARLLIYLPTNTDSATTASVKVATGSSPPDQTPTPLELTLSRTIGGTPSTDTLTLAPSDTIQRIEDVIDWIGSLDKGWRVGFRIGRDEEWVDPEIESWRSSLVATTRLARFARPVALSETGATAVTAYGDEDDAAELRFYNVYRAAMTALRVMQQRGLLVEGRSEGDMSIDYGHAALLESVRGRVSLGIYA